LKNRAHLAKASFSNLWSSASSLEMRTAILSALRYLISTYIFGRHIYVGTGETVQTAQIRRKMMVVKT